MSTVRTPKGTELPLINLKGKEYLQVAHRLQWFNEAAARFRIVTQFLKIDDEQTVAQAHVTLFNDQGIEVKAVTATKRETKKDFSDHTEKAETGAIGRALALMGYGTQFALSDLDEGSRLADAPVTKVAKSEVKAEFKVGEATVKVSSAGQGIAAVTTTKLPYTEQGVSGSMAAVPAKISTFRKNKSAEPATVVASKADGWE